MLLAVAKRSSQHSWISISSGPYCITGPGQILHPWHQEKFRLEGEGEDQDQDERKITCNPKKPLLALIKG